jgi:hypothetical protein
VLATEKPFKEGLLNNGATIAVIAPAGVVAVRRRPNYLRNLSNKGSHRNPINDK